MDFSAAGLEDGGKEADLDFKIGRPQPKWRAEGKQLNSIRSWTEQIKSAAGRDQLTAAA